ncbi:MAG TPA: hypothetical protein VFH82_02555 [Gemmatimonadota bacterium]|nr:hypothetical protein [Gemmatimonadota bacterium]
MLEDAIIAALALNGILCTAALIWLLRRAGLRHDREWPAEHPTVELPDKLELLDLDGDSFGRYPVSEICSIMAEHYPAAFERYRTGRMESNERLQVWDACCAIHDARFEIEELCS